MVCRPWLSATAQNIIEMAWPHGVSSGLQARIDACCAGKGLLNIILCRVYAVCGILAAIGGGGAGGEGAAGSFRIILKTSSGSQ